jgi:tRNA (guanine-N7-)-methyltransferase
LANPGKLIVYGRRIGKPLKAGRQAALVDALPRLRIVLPQDGAKLEPRSLFEKPVEACWLEIGFGNGEHAAGQAAAHPHVGLIGCEVFINGVAALARQVNDLGLANVRIYDDDARKLLATLPDASIDRVFVLFPDPWPKVRHAKRRFISPANLDSLARVLKDSGELRVASDDAGYVRWSLLHLTTHAAFRWRVENAADWRNPPADSIPTRYQEKALRQGRKPVFLAAERRPRAVT